MILEKNQISKTKSKILRKDINTFDVVDENTLIRNTAYNKFLLAEDVKVFDDVCNEIKNGNYDNY